MYQRKRAHFSVFKIGQGRPPPSSSASCEPVIETRGSEKFSKLKYKNGLQLVSILLQDLYFPIRIYLNIIIIWYIFSDGLIYADILVLTYLKATLMC